MTRRSVLCFPTAVAAFILIAVQSCEGRLCYSCRSHSVEGCQPAEGRVVNCGELLPYSHMKQDERNLNEILRILTKKEQAYRLDDEYDDLAMELRQHVSDVEGILKLKPASYGREDFARFNVERRSAVVMYKDILAKWKKEDAGKTKALWAEIKRNVTALKQNYNEVDEMPKPPKRSNRNFANRILEYNEYKQMMGEWLQAAERQIMEGTYISRADFDVPIQDNWRKGSDEYLYMSPSERRAAELENSSFEDLPVDGSWCVSLQSRVGVIRGCGIKFEGIRFETGCHNMSGKHEGITYCRCEVGRPCLQENQGLGMLNVRGLDYVRNGCVGMEPRLILLSFVVLWVLGSSCNVGDSKLKRTS